jgi:hypothetical protein
MEAEVRTVQLYSMEYQRFHGMQHHRLPQEDGPEEEEAGSRGSLDLQHFDFLQPLELGENFLLF